MNTPGSFRHLKIAIFLVLSVLALGIVGYMLIEHLSFIDALYTTIDMMATVGNVVHPLSEAGRIFTMAIIVLGVGSLLYTFGAGMEYVIEGHFNQAIRRHFMENKIAALRNNYITLSARHLNSKLFIVARANHTETEAKLKLAGADRLFSPYKIAGHRMANLALQPGVVEFFDAITKAGNLELAVEEVMLAPTSPLVGKTMADAQNILSDGTMLVAVKKPGGLMMGSRLETRIETGDTVIVVGAPEQLAAFKQKNSLH